MHDFNCRIIRECLKHGKKKSISCPSPRQWENLVPLPPPPNDTMIAKIGSTMISSRIQNIVSKFSRENSRHKVDPSLDLSELKVSFVIIPYNYLLISVIYLSSSFWEVNPDWPCLESIEFFLSLEGLKMSLPSSTSSGSAKTAYAYGWETFWRICCKYFQLSANKRCCQFNFFSHNRRNR